MPVVCYYDTEARYRQRERGAMKLTATYVLIGINIVIFLLETSQGGSTNRDVAMKFGAQYTPYVRRGQWYRLITSMFLHFGFIHLLCNMYSLSNLGPALERFFGIPLFLVLYLISGLAGNLLSYYKEIKTGQYRLSAGASGAVFGLLGAYLVFAVLPGYGGVSLYGILRVLAIKAFYAFSNRSINAMAHLGGLIAGIVVTACLLLVL